MNIIVGIAVTLAVVMAFALLHEMFHYLTAKALGMEVKIILFSLLALHFSNISYPIFSICMALLVVNFISLPMEWMVK